MHASYQRDLGEIDDLRYFNNKLSRGLRVPSSYLPTGPDESMTSINDGRVGTALIQEYRFNQYCQRMQNQISQKLDDEFKMFLRFRGFNIDSSVFNIKFNSPQNFASYRQAELDTQRVNVFSAIEGMPYMSKRFALERFLGLSAEEIQKNQELWSEEHGEAEIENLEGKDLRSVGVSPGDIDADMSAGDQFGDLAPEEGEGEGEAVVMPGAEPSPEEI